MFLALNESINPSTPFIPSGLNQEYGAGLESPACVNPLSQNRVYSLLETTVRSFRLHPIHRQRQIQWLDQLHSSFLVALLNRVIIGMRVRKEG